jgi:hypothetical protein
MGVLLITCPATGKEFSTGLNVANEALKGLPRNQETIAFCPTASWNTNGARVTRAMSMLSRPAIGLRTNN